MLESNAFNDLVQEDSRTMDVDENFQAGTDTAPFSPPSRPSTTSPPRKVVLKSDIKQRLGKIPSKRSTDVFPCFYRDNFPPELSPPFIRLTKVLPTELTSSIFSARSIQELYCLEVTQLYKSECPPELGYCTPHMVPSIFFNMREDQAAF